MEFSITPLLYDSNTLVVTKVKTSTICCLHLCIGTTCELNLVRPAVLIAIGLISFSVFTAKYH